MAQDVLESSRHPIFMRRGVTTPYDVTVSLTGYEPNDMVFNELGNSQGSFSYVTPSSDLDIDDTTLGKLLTEAHREHADYRNPEGVSVSQSSLSVVFDRTGKPVGERNVDQSIGFGVTRNTYSAHSKFSENTQAEKMVDRTGKLVEIQANKIPKTNKKETTIERGNPCDDSEIPEWLQEFRENLVDDEIPLQGGSHANSPHEVSLEPTDYRET